MADRIAPPVRHDSPGIFEMVNGTENGNGAGFRKLENSGGFTFMDTFQGGGPRCQVERFSNGIFSESSLHPAWAFASAFLLGGVRTNLEMPTIEGQYRTSKGCIE